MDFWTEEVETMFCMNCGTKLPDHAKFCFNCGAKVPDGLGDGEAASVAPEEQVPDTIPPVTEPQEESVPGSHFTILGKYEVELPRGTAVYNQLWAPFNREGTRLALLARHEIRKHLKEHTVENPVEFSAQVLAYCMSACGPLFEQAVNLLIDHDIDYVTKKDLWDRLDDSVKSTDLVQAMLADQAAIEDYEKDMAVEKMADKASWRGGGFGIMGAITGTIKASMMNTAQDALSSLGRSITGNSYSDRLENFIRDRSAKRNYPAMACDFISTVCRFDLFTEVHRLLVAECDLPEASFETDKADSRRKNLLERFANGKIEEEDVFKGLCSCLEITGNTLPVYKTLLELEPSAARDVFQMAEAEGEELDLARSVWQTYMKDKKVGTVFHFPDWVPNFLSRPFYPVTGPAMLLALLIELRDLPQMFRREESPHVDLALAAGTYWIPADADDVASGAWTARWCWNSKRQRRPTGMLMTSTSISCTSPVLQRHGLKISERRNSKRRRRRLKLATRRKRCRRSSLPQRWAALKRPGRRESCRREAASRKKRSGLLWKLLCWARRTPPGCCTSI